MRATILLLVGVPILVLLYFGVTAIIREYFKNNK
jgi:hypothetical protein